MALFMFAAALVNVALGNPFIGLGCACMGWALLGRSAREG